MLINYSDKEIILNQEQLSVYQKLSKISDFLSKNSAGSKWWNFFTGKKAKISGNHLSGSNQNLYIYGDVGRGKTMLVKDFYDSLKISQKIYFHFNDFTKAIHENLRDLRKEKKKYPDELIEAVNRIAWNNKLLCLDELQAVDIADAMIISRIFTFLLQKNIIIIFTSNCHPLELYSDGLARELFLEFVNNILLKECEVINLGGRVDYRGLMGGVKTSSDNVDTGIADEIYFTDNRENDNKIKRIINIVTANQPLIPKQIEVWQRKITISKTYKNIAIIDFCDLSLANFGASDFHEICKNFDLIFLLKIPDFNKENNDELRRFILLIDEIYESKTALIMSAAVDIDDLGTKILKEDASKIKLFKRSNLKAFRRTISRLKEISSSQYFQTTKLFKQI